MIAIVIFTLFAILVRAEADCDGEVTTCGACVASTETFAQCQWCSSNGNCNGKYDVVSNCPSGGQWLSVCSATTGVQASLQTPSPTARQCSTSEMTNIQASSTKCAETSDPCAATACAVYLIKTLRLSTTCLEAYQTACVDFVCFFVLFVLMLSNPFKKGMRCGLCYWI